MKKTLPTLLTIGVLALLLVALAGVYRFGYLTSPPGYDTKPDKHDDFEVVEVLGESCQTDADCATPIDYAIRSICPYEAVCIDARCTVVCPFAGEETAATDPLDATYVIDGNEVTLTGGHAEVSVAPDSASKIVTRYFGNDVRTDLNNDGREDVAFLLLKETGGSGTFYYVVAALNTKNGWVGSHAMFLGDRIAPQTTEVSSNPNHQGVIVINYADRAPDEPMTVQPSVGKSAYLKLDPESLKFGEVVVDFEGEADPSSMTLSMKPWTWVHTTYNNDTVLTPRALNAFVLNFTKEGTVSVSTDCNSMSGSYEVDGNTITFGPMAATKMYCIDSQEAEFAAMLSEMHSFFFTSRGELVFDLKYDSGSSVFR